MAMTLFLAGYASDPSTHLEAPVRRPTPVVQILEIEARVQNTRSKIDGFGAGR